jgi:hypothetical protein
MTNAGGESAEDRRPRAPWRRSGEIAAGDLEGRGGEETEGRRSSEDASDEGLGDRRRRGDRAYRWGRLGRARRGGGGCLVRVVGPTVGTVFRRHRTMPLEHSILINGYFLMAY